MLRNQQQRQPTPTELALYAAREKLAAYAITQWPGYQVARHHRLIAETLEQVERGEIARLVIEAPPRHGKSQLATGFFPAWYLGRHPDRQIITAAYGEGLANDIGRKVRDLVRDPAHRAVFPGSVLRSDSKAVGEFGLCAGGKFRSVGVGGATTGRGANVFLVDDPIKDAEAAQSETYQRRTRDWYEFVARTRLMPGGAIVIIMTRWHEADLVGWLLDTEGDIKDGGKWHVLRLPAEADEEDDPLGREIGEPLWPEWFPSSAFDDIRVKAHVWNALYQQRPQPATGGMLQRGWWQYYRVLPAVFDEMIGSWDCTFKESKTSDYVVGQVWGRLGGQFYLVDQVRERMDFPATVAEIVRQHAKYPRMRAILIEDKANGPAIISTLRNRISKLIAVEPEGGKVARASAVSGLIQAGNVLLPETAPFTSDVVGECASFPLGKHDDIVDAMSQALTHLSTGPRVAAYGDDQTNRNLPKARA